MMLFLAAVLMVIDASWVSYMKYIPKDDSFRIEWVQLNFITAGFFGVFLFSPTNQDRTFISFIFFTVLKARTVLDYLFGWSDLYSKPKEGPAH